MAQTNRPRLLDLFCGAGGCSVGYHRAGFDVVGVDIRPQPNYPFEFHRGDALKFLERYYDSCTDVSSDFDAIHASPPCQAHSAMGVMWNAREHEDLIPETRRQLRVAGLPYVIENVPGAPLDHPVTLCGAALGLQADGYYLARHRLFECSFPVLTPACAHGSLPTLGIYGDHARDRRRRAGSRDCGQEPRTAYAYDTASRLMGIDWMNWRELSQAIPPAYTEHIGGYLMAELNARAAA